MKAYVRAEIDFVEFDENDIMLTSCTSGVCNCVGTVDDGWEVCYANDTCEGVTF